MIPPSIDKHPMRCETCNQPHTDHLCESNGRKLRLSESDKEFLEIVGCASHSSNESLRAPNSSSLIAMAHQEWKNREERKPNAPNERDWCSGWMDGFLSPYKPDWSKEHDRAIEQAAREKVLEEIVSKCNSEIQKYGNLFEDKDRYGRLKANYLIRDYCEALKEESK